MLPPESAFHKCEQRAIPQSEFKKYDTKHLKEDPFIETKEDFTEGSMQDPEVQKLTGSEILKKVVKEKMSLNDDSFFDDLITLYIGKGVGAFKTDEDILTPIEERLDPDITGAELDYYRAKLDRARIKLEIEDPKQARNKILQNIFFLKKDSKFYDNNFKDVYDKEAINFTYARYFTTKETSTGWLRKNPKRIAVEGWVCRPKDYIKETPIINQGKKQYINSYVPNDLVAEEILVVEHVLGAHAGDLVFQLDLATVNTHGEAHVLRHGDVHDSPDGDTVSRLGLKIHVAA